MQGMGAMPGRGYSRQDSTFMRSAGDNQSTHDGSRPLSGGSMGGRREHVNSISQSHSGYPYNSKNTGKSDMFQRAGSAQNSRALRAQNTVNPQGMMGNTSLVGD